MATEHDGRELKRAMGKRSRGQPIPKAVRAPALAYVRRRRSEGASQQAIADELGVSQHTVSSWLRRAAKQEVPAFLPVRIDHGAAHATSAVVVTTPRGLTIEGLSFDDVCAMIVRLG